MQLRLPSSPRFNPSPSFATSSSSAQHRQICSICHQNPSPYTCPNCNIPYCSLVCYRDEKRHGACLSTFQSRAQDELRQTAEQDHQAEAEQVDVRGKDAERTRVLDLLRRYQAEQEQGEGGIDLQSLMEPVDRPGLDFDSSDGDSHTDSVEDDTNLTEAALPSSTEALLAMLSDQQRETFLIAVGQNKQVVHSSTSQQQDRAQKLWEKIVQDEQRVVESVKQVGQDQQANLWWLDTTFLPSEARKDSKVMMDPIPYVAAFDDQVARLISARQKKASTSSTELVWNCLALLTAYTYILLHLDIRSFASLIADPSVEDERSVVLSVTLLERLCPFLFALPAQSSGDRSFSSSDATLLLPGPASVSAYLLSRLGDRDRSSNPSLLLLELYGKTVPLLSQGFIVETDSAERGKTTLSKAHRALGDIWLLLDYALRRPNFRESVILPVNGHDLQTRHSTSHTNRSLQQACRKLIFYSATCASKSVDCSSILLSSPLVLGSAAVDKDNGGDALSSLSSLDLSEGSEQRGIRRPHRLIREAKTLREEMDQLRLEVEGLEDEDRWQAARRLDEQRRSDPVPSQISVVEMDTTAPPPSRGEGGEGDGEMVGSTQSTFAEKRNARLKKDKESRKGVTRVEGEPREGSW